MENHHIHELRAAFDRALSELAAVAESEILPYEVRAAAMQAHISIAAKSRETIAHLLSLITPSGVTGTRVKVADLIETIGRAAQRASNATVIGNMGEFKSGPVKGDSVDGIEVVDSTTVKAIPTTTGQVVMDSRTDDVMYGKHSITNAAMPAGATVMHKWDKG